MRSSSGNSFKHGRGDSADRTLGLLPSRSLSETPGGSRSRRRAINVPHHAGASVDGMSIPGQSGVVISLGRPHRRRRSPKASRKGGFCSTIEFLRFHAHKVTHKRRTRLLFRLKIFSPRSQDFRFTWKAVLFCGSLAARSSAGTTRPDPFGVRLLSCHQ